MLLGSMKGDPSSPIQGDADEGKQTEELLYLTDVLRASMAANLIDYEFEVRSASAYWVCKVATQYEVLSACKQLGARRQMSTSELC